MESFDKKTEVKGEVSALLNLLIENKKEGLAYIHAIVDGQSFNYKSLQKKEFNHRKYTLESSLLEIAKTLNQYVQQCDTLSFGNNLHDGLRCYLVRPYLNEEFFYLLDQTIEDIADIYKIDLNLNNLFLDTNNSKKVFKDYGRKEKIRDSLKEIIEIESMNEFVSDLEGTVDFVREVNLSTYKKI
jgi:hypothetical protein